MAATINADPSPGKVLVLPAGRLLPDADEMGFFGVDSIANLLIQRGVVQPKPDGCFRRRARLQGRHPGNSDRAAGPAISPPYPPARRQWNRQIIVRHDLIRDMPGRNIADDEVLAKALKRTPGMTRTSNGELELWQTKPASGDPVRAYNNIVSAGARPDAAAGVIGSVGTGNAVMALKASTKPSCWQPWTTHPR